MDYVFIDHCRISDMNSVLLSHLVTSRYLCAVCQVLQCDALQFATMSCYVQVHTYHDELYAVPKYNITVVELTIVFSSYDE